MKRTPVNFPRMKVRGAKNKWKSASRYETVVILPHVQFTDEGNGSYTGKVASEGGHMVKMTTVKDGWGRSIR